MKERIQGTIIKKKLIKSGKELINLKYSEGIKPKGKKVIKEGRLIK